MIIQQAQIVINSEHFKTFMQVSYDRNPLHTDESYARRTFLGQTVFFGMGAVLLVLATWAKGQPFELLSIQGTFHRPLLVGHIYDVEITKEGSTISARILEQGILMNTISWKAVITNKGHEELDSSNEVFNPLLYANEPDNLEMDIGNRKYALNVMVLDRLERFFGLSSKQIPRAQLTALLWSSYFVGMEYPGRRALFSDFSFDFTNSNRSFEASKLKSIFHKVYDLIEISGQATCLSKIKLQVYLIPEVIDYPIIKVASIIGKSKRLNGKKIFVSGSARGFGSVLSKALALQGATILLNCRDKNTSAVQTATEIQSAGGICHLIEADLTKKAVTETLYQLVSSYEKRIDWIINNASPKIPTKKFKEQTTVDFISFIEESLSIILNTCYALFPLLNEGGWVFGISSMYLDYPQPGFSHYLASKSALEGLLLGLAKEYPKYNFAFFRAPRMFTDQTNVVANFNHPISAIEVAKRFLSAFERLHPSGNFNQIKYEFD